MPMKRVWLTIDDSPCEGTKEKIDLLRERGIPALFFAQGSRLEDDPDSMLYALQHGYPVGNHAYTHTHFSRLSTRDCIAEIERTERLLDEIYSRAGWSHRQKYFRYPYGGKGNGVYGSPRLLLRMFDPKFRSINRYLKAGGYRSLRIPLPAKRYPERFLLNDADCYWTKDLCEWHISSLGTSLSSVLERFDRAMNKEAGNEIILMHDHADTHTYFASILDHLVNLGFHFEAFEDAPTFRSQASSS